MVKNWLRKDECLEERLLFLKERIAEEFSKKKIRKVEKFIIAYNNSLDSLWPAGPSKSPMPRINYLDKENSRLIYEAGKCNFCGSRREYIEVLPYFFWRHPSSKYM